MEIGWCDENAVLVRHPSKKRRGIRKIRVPTLEAQAEMKR
jgi:hypothetical protein